MSDKDYDNIECIDTGLIESMSYDSIMCEAWDRYGDILINPDIFNAWIQSDIDKDIFL